MIAVKHNSHCVFTAFGYLSSKLFVGELRQAIEGKTDRLGKTHRQPIAVRRRPNYCSCSYNTAETFLDPIYFRLHWLKTTGARACFGAIFVAQDDVRLSLRRDPYYAAGPSPMGAVSRLPRKLASLAGEAGFAILITSGL
jgi:hypothetical protein